MEGTGITQPAALPALSHVTVGGKVNGNLDLKHNAAKVASLTLADGGEVRNGSITAATIVKQGAGRATLAAMPQVATAWINHLAPGLWEGLTSRNAQDPYRFNPKQNVRLTTYVANNGKSSNNDNSGGMWNGDYHTYAYSGYMWNRTATNQTWYRGALDDYLYLYLDNTKFS